MSRLDTLRASGLDLYPARSRRTHTLREAAAPASANGEMTVAGRLLACDPHAHTGVLEDATGRLDLLFGPHGDTNFALPTAGDIIECTGRYADARFAVTRLRVLVPSLRARPRSLPRHLLDLRADVFRLTRRFFEERSYLEVDTPYLLRVPELTPAIKSFETVYHDAAGRSTARYLQTSPEHYMKRMLTAGCERIFQLCRFFRDGERFAAHHPEFTGLEWYQAYADYHEVMDTTEALVASLAEALAGTALIPYQGRRIDLDPPWPRKTVRDMFSETARIDLGACRTREDFRRAAGACGIAAPADDTWDDLFHRVFMQCVEPRLPPDRPVFLTDYPAQLPSLARRTPGDDRFVERFELYIGGLELANAFTELNDPEEQRARFEAQRRMKEAREGYAGGIDEELLAALEWGMPPAGGIALGMDRLIMLFADAAEIEEVLPFPFTI